MREFSARGNSLAALSARLAAMESLLAELPSRFADRLPGKLLRRVVQASHGFSVGDPIRHNGTSWVKSKADTTANAVVAGIVVSVPHTGVFVVATGGYIPGLTGLTAGALHYLGTSGGLTTTAPTIAVPVLMADSTTSGVMFPTLPSNAGGGYPISVGTWHVDDITATDLYTVSDTGGATLCILEFIGGGGGGGYAPSVAPGGFGGGGGASGVRITSPILTIADGYEIDATIGAAGSGGTSGGTTGSTGGDTTVSMDGFASTTSPGGEGGRGGGISSLAGDAGQATVANVPYDQSAQSGEPGTYDQGGGGGRGLNPSTANYGGGGNGAAPDTGGVNGADGIAGAVRVWSNGAGLTLST